MKKVWIPVALIFLILFAHGAEGSAQENETEGTGARSPSGDQVLKRMEEMQKRIDQLEAESAARRKLQVSDEEKKQKEKEVLTAAGREYSLLTRGTLELEYKLGYDYSSRDAIAESVSIERTYDHSITHTISSTYGVLDNLTFGASIPFVYRYNKVDTEDELDETDVGDIVVSFQWEPVKRKAGSYSVILNLGADLPSGRSPYKVDYNNELATGSGVYAYTAGFSMSQPLDPVVVFGLVSYTYTQEANGLNASTIVPGKVLESVNPGDKITLGMGFGYSLSYMVSLSQQVALSYVTGSDYTFRDGTVNNSSYTSASYVVGVGWRLAAKTTLFTSLDFGLTSDRPDFSFSFRIPFDFMI